jgi:hypothetical protein
MSSEKAEPSPSPTRRWSIGMLGLTLIVSFFVCVSMLGRNHIAIMLRDMLHTLKTSPPLMNELVMTNVYFMIVPVLALVGIAKEFMIRNARITLYLNALHLLAVITLLNIYLLAINLPLVDLTRQLMKLNK